MAIQSKKPLVCLLSFYPLVILNSHLGQGKFAVVYRAETKDKHVVALKKIKVIGPHPSSDIEWYGNRSLI